MFFEVCLPSAQHFKGIFGTMAFVVAELTRVTTMSLLSHCHVDSCDSHKLLDGYSAMLMPEPPIHL